MSSPSYGCGKEKRLSHQSIDLTARLALHPGRKSISCGGSKVVVGGEDGFVADGVTENKQKYW